MPAVIAVAHDWSRGGEVHLPRLAAAAKERGITVQSSPHGLRAGTVAGWHTVALVREHDGSAALELLEVDPEAALLDAHGFREPSIAADGRHAVCFDRAGDKVLVVFQTTGTGERVPVVVGRELTS